MTKQHWTAERNGNYKTSPRSKSAPVSDVVIRYDPKPNPPLDAKGRPTSFSLTFPALALTAWVGEPEVSAAHIARELNTYPVLLDALKRAKQFIENGVELGFIRMPDASTPDPAHDALPAILAAIEAAEAPLQPIEVPHG